MRSARVNGIDECTLTREVPAFVDGDLQGPLKKEFCEHLEGCSICRRNVSEHARFLENLDVTLQKELPIELPDDFCREIAARARYDLGGLRCPAERWKAFGLVALLFSIGLFATGGTVPRVLAHPVILLALRVPRLLSFGLLFVYDLGISLAIAFKAIGGSFPAGARWVQPSMALLFFVSLASLLYVATTGSGRKSQE